MQFSLRSAFFTLASIAALQIPNTFASQTATPPGLSLPSNQTEAHLGGNFYGALQGRARFRLQVMRSLVCPLSYQ